MVSVKVKLFAGLRQYQPDQDNLEFTLKIEEGSSVSDLVDLLKIPPEKVQIVFVNNRKKQEDYILKEGDEVGIFPPVAGG